MAYTATYERRELAALFDIKGKSKDVLDWCGAHLPPLPKHANSYTTIDTKNLYFVGPDHWILHSELSEEVALEAALKPTEAPSFVSIVKVSDTMALFDVTGADAEQVMATACPMDLHPSVFSADAVSFTEMFGLRALVLRSPQGFAFAVEQSYAVMVEDYLGRALR